MPKPALDDVMDYGSPAEGEGDAHVDPDVEAASVVREAIESKDDAALYDALCSIVRMEMSKGEEDEEMHEMADKGKKPSLSVALLRGK